MPLPQTHPVSSKSTVTSAITACISGAARQLPEGQEWSWNPLQGTLSDGALVWPVRVPWKPSGARLTRSSLSVGRLLATEGILEKPSQGFPADSVVKNALPARDTQFRPQSGRSPRAAGQLSLRPGAPRPQLRKPVCPGARAPPQEKRVRRTWRKARTAEA